ncbi:MAG: hypothetical protein NDF57_04825 [archaeon GBS-70-058]|nr:hypothetical protein [Candidatus Culexarchaeum nevadense]
MKKYINKKYITIFLIVIITTILLGNYLTCPQYLKSMGLDYFNGSLIWFKEIKFNSTIINYNGFLGEATFGFIAYIPILHTPTIPEDVKEIGVEIVKINEKTYNPLVKGFIINIEGITLFLHPNNTEIQWPTVFFSKLHSLSSDYSIFNYKISHSYHYLPKTLYARVDYSVHVIINPYFEIWYSEFKYITIGFHIKIYSGSVTIPITIKPE